VPYVQWRGEGGEVGGGGGRRGEENKLIPTHHYGQAMESRRMAESLVPAALASATGTSASAAAISGIGGASFSSSSGAAASSSIPEHVRLTGQMLHFKAYFNEAVVESPVESYRVRTIILRYFLEDDTIEAFEERRRNDGMSGNKFLRRMQHPAVSLETLRVGATVTLYGRTLRIVACDDATRTFYEERGTPQPANESVPEDPFARTSAASRKRATGDSFGKKMNAVSRYVEAVRGAQVRKKDTLGKFLAHGDEALRFRVMWNTESEADPGEKQYFMLTYFLSSDEVEIKRLRGYGEYPGMNTLLTRRKLPKFILAHDDRERSAEDGTGDEDYYHPEDLRVGDAVHVFGRKMLLFDCDDFTRAWYASELGVDQASGRMDVAEKTKPKPTLPVPPHTGFGSEEDSLQSWRFLDPRKKPVPKPAPHDEFEGKTLQFTARLVSRDPIDAERSFRITWYLYDDTLAIYEPPRPNSGMVGGKFLARDRLKNPATGRNFEAGEFFVGARLTIKGHAFEVVEADSYSLRHMESNSRLWPMSSFEYVIANLRQKLQEKRGSLRELFRKFDLDASQSISVDELQSMVRYFGMDITRQEAITVLRHYDKEGTGLLSYHDFMDAFSISDSEGGVAAAMGPTRSELTRERERIEKEGVEEYGKRVLEAARTEEEEQHTDEVLARLARALLYTRDQNFVHEIFSRFDKTKDNLVDKEEVRAILGDQWFHLSPRDVDLIVKRLFRDGKDEAKDVLRYDELMGLIYQYSDRIVRRS
jgi:Ca2+-binding EF-hand superfamily protein